MIGACVRVREATSGRCGSATEKMRHGLWLCDECYYGLRLMLQDGPAQIFRRFVDDQVGPQEWGPGATYCVLLPNGRFKIGFVNDPKKLAARWQTLSRRHGDRVVPLCTETGGRARELYRHAQFHASRVPGQGEQFDPTPELRAYVTVGHTPDGVDALAEFNRWKPRPGTLTI